MLILKPSREALAFWTLFKSMKPEIKDEVREMIIHETTLDGDEEFTTDALTEISMETFKDIWDAPENEHWNDFINDRLQCTSKEI